MGLATRGLGGDGLAVSPLGLGCVGMSELYGPREPAESAATIEAALDAGVTLFDTSDVYGGGHNERFLGEALGSRRDQAVIATKFGAIRHKRGGYSVCGRKDYVTSACEASLERLGTDRIDLYFQHRMDPDTPIEETVGAMAELVTAGKVRYLGLSECSASNLRRAHATHPVAAVQIEYSLFAREPEIELLSVCRELGVGVVAYCPLGRGILSAAITDSEALTDGDYRQVDPRYQPGNISANLELVRSIAGMADSMGVTSAQLALAWLLARGDDIVPIPGTKRRSHLAENLSAARIDLSPNDITTLDRLVPIGAVAGDRYPPAELAHLRDLSR